MFRLTLISGKWYANEIDDVENHQETIQELVEQGSIVALCDDLEWFADELGIEKDDIQVID